jgi:hypothetical protein
VATHGNILVTNFPQIPQALLAARRMQWAIQGLAQGLGQGLADAAQSEIAATVLMQSAADLPGPTTNSAFLAALEKASPGEILLASGVCQLAETLPALRLLPASGKGPRKLVWKSGDSAATAQQDEAELAARIAELGLSGQAVAASASVAVGSPASSSPADTRAKGSTFTANVASQERGQALPGIVQNKRLLWTGGGLAALLVIGVSIAVFGSRHSGESKSGETGTPVSASQAAGSNGVLGNPAPAPAQKSLALLPPGAGSKFAEKSREPAKPSGKDKKTEEHASPAAPAEHEQAAKLVTPSKACKYPDQSEWSYVLDTADGLYSGGKYGEAEKRYRAILECDRNNGRASQGLSQALEAQRR